jgi:AraC-like DNA-binding protein
MMLLNTPPGTDEQGLTDYYRRCATEGSVFSSLVADESYGVAESFDPAWSVAALCWCAGGTETYEFVGGDTIRLKAGAVLAIGENARYAWWASSPRPFRSSMIVFPRAMTRSLAHGTLDDSPCSDKPSLVRTGLFKPDPKLRAGLHALSRAMHRTSSTPEELEEKATMVAASLVAVQQADATRPDQLNSVKRSTREELCKRLRKSIVLIHDAYDDSSLDLAALAREACIARHHFVRVFGAAYGMTPLAYLGEVRMEAAARLLEAMDISVVEVSRAVGFTNRSAFQRRFREYFGTTPARWYRRA